VSIYIYIYIYIYISISICMRGLLHLQGEQRGDESRVWAGDAAALLALVECLVEGEAVAPHEVGDHHRRGAGDALVAVHEHHAAGLCGGYAEVERVVLPHSMSGLWGNRWAQLREEGARAARRDAPSRESNQVNESSTLAKAHNGLCGGGAGGQWVARRAVAFTRYCHY